MICVYFGDDAGLTSAQMAKEVNGLSRKFGAEIIRYDAFQHPVLDVVSECQTLSLTGDRKIVCFENCYFLSSKQIKGSIPDSKQDFDSFTDYIRYPNDLCDLYISVPGPLSQTNAIVKLLKSGSVKMVNCAQLNESDYIDLAIRKAGDEGKKITRDAASLLLKLTGNDYLMYQNCLDLLLTYSDNVTADDVDKMIHHPLEDDVFQIVTCFVKGDRKRALKVYRDLREGGSLPITLISVFATQFRFMAMARYLIEQGEDNDSIARELSRGSVKVNPNRIYYTRKDTKNISFSKFLSVLSELGRIEENVKLEGDDADDLIELFLAEYPL